MNTSYIYLEYTACAVCKKVGEHMKADEAMLLPTLRKELVNEAFAFMFPWLGDLSGGLRPCHHHQGARLSMVYVFNYRVVVVFEFSKSRKIRARSDLREVVGPNKQASKQASKHTHAWVQ